MRSIDFMYENKIGIMMLYNHCSNDSLLYALSLIIVNLILTTLLFPLNAIATNIFTDQMCRNLLIWKFSNEAFSLVINTDFVLFFHDVQRALAKRARFLGQVQSQTIYNQMLHSETIQSLITFFFANTFIQHSEFS